MEREANASSSSLTDSTSRQSLFASPSAHFGGLNAGSSSITSANGGLASMSTPGKGAGAVEGAGGNAATPIRTAARGKRNSLAEFGTPIKVANSSPYRTPEPSSRAASLLLRSPFGTPASKTATPAAGGTAGGSGQVVTSGPAPPPKALSGSAALMARMQAAVSGGGASTARPFQGKLYLPYSSYVELALQTNVDRLYIAAVVSVHVLLSALLFSPFSPFASLALPFRPTLLLLSLVAFVLGILPLVVVHRASIRNSSRYLAPAARLSHDMNLFGASLPFASPGAHYLWSLSNASTWVGVTLYALSGLALASAHGTALMLYAKSEDRHWSPYLSVPIRTSDGYRTTATRPNERLFFLMGSNLLLGAIYGIYRSLSLAHLSSASGLLGAPCFASQATVQSASSRISKELRRRLPVTFVLGLVLPPVLLLSYLPIRRPLFRLILSVVGHHSPLRPIFIPSFRASFLSVGLLVRVTALGTTSTLAWEMVSILWDVFASQPFTDRGGLSTFSRAPKNCLISGIQARRNATAEGPEQRVGKEAREYFSHFAFAEQAVLAATEPDRRRAIFRDVGSSTPGATGATKSAWQLLAQECLAVIEEEREHVAKRGKSSSAGLNASGVSSSTSAPASSTKKPVDSSHDALQSGKQVVKPAPQTIWDKLASPSSALGSGGAQPPKTVASTSAAPSGSSTAVADAGLNDLLHRIAPRPETEVSTLASRDPAVTRTSTTMSSTGTNSSGNTFFALIVTSLLRNSFQILRTAFLLLPADIQHVLRTAPGLRTVPQAWSYLVTPTTWTLLASRTLPKHAALDVWGSQILSALLAASVDEDEYGSVALSAKEGCGVDQVVSALVRLLQELQTWKEQEQGQEPRQQSEQERQLWDEEVEPLMAALRASVTIVLAAFEPRAHVWSSETQMLLSRTFSL